MKYFLFAILISFKLLIFSQNDSITDVYLDKVILYGDLGYNSCPFDVKIKNLESFNFRNNIKPFIGLGLNYKLISIRLGTLLNYHLKGIEDFSKTKILKLSSEISYKQFYTELNYYRLSGYTLLKNNYEISNNTKFDNLFFNKASLNFCVFTNKKFTYNLLKGIKRSIKKKSLSLYVKSINAILDISNKESIIPRSYDLNFNLDYLHFTRLSAYEIGGLGGLALALKSKNNFQIGSMLGYGAVFIDRTIYSSEKKMNFRGLSPRYDLHFYIGYNVKKFFVMNFFDFEQRNIDFSEIEINSRLISYRLVAGYRF